MFLAMLLLPAISFTQQKPDSLGQLASDFWTWRAIYRPFTFDDIPRMERAAGMRDWSEAAIAKQRGDLSGFERRWKAMHPDDWPIAQRVDYRLMGSAIARVRWELDINPRWRRDPTFYIEQTVGALEEEFLPPPPFSETRWREIVMRAENVPSILEQAKANLKSRDPVRAIGHCFAFRYRYPADARGRWCFAHNSQRRSARPFPYGDDQGEPGVS
jgi:class 3 adenylate cyclase